jgi:AMP nucleosidase
MLADPASGYTSFVSTGNAEIKAGDEPLLHPAKLPQMPTYHLKRRGGQGITLVNIGVGPSNAKTATDHIAVLRPHAWLMVGHCAGLRNSQSLGDFVLAHAYLREDHVLDADLPIWVPIPALAEIQIALEDAVESVTKLEGYELKRIMRTGTVATIDNRNWELRDQSGPVQRLSQSRAVALDMESATIAANGFRFRVPYGTLLCVSDSSTRPRSPAICTSASSRWRPCARCRWNASTAASCAALKRRHSSDFGAICGDFR